MRMSICMKSSLLPFVHSHLASNSYQSSSKKKTSALLDPGVSICEKSPRGRRARPKRIGIVPVAERDGEGWIWIDRQIPIVVNHCTAAIFRRIENTSTRPRWFQVDNGWFEPDHIPAMVLAMMHMARYINDYQRSLRPA